MRVVIVGKTRMKGGVCVGGVIEETGESVRLIPEGELCNPTDTEFDVGEVWDLAIRPRANRVPPHVEDHDLTGRRILVDDVENLDQWIREHCTIWQGSRDTPFGGLLKFRENGTAFIEANGALPACSTGFWRLPGRMLYDPFTKSNGEEVPYFHSLGENRVKMKYVGTIPVSQLPRVLQPGTLVRLSLAHAWSNAPREEDRDKLFLQLSGWFF